MEAVVEFQGFKDNYNEFIVKEFVLVSKYTKVQFVFSSPYSKYCLNSKIMKTADWLTRNYHFIDWDEGGIHYDPKLLKHILKPYTLVYTKGLEKVKFLEKLHKNVKEIKINKDKYLPNADCVLPQHYKGECALKNAIFYYNHLNL